MKKLLSILLLGGFLALPLSWLIAQQTPSAHCSQMMSMHQGMMQQFKTNDARLDELIGALKSSQGAARQTQTEKLAIEIANQLKASHQYMNNWNGHMMQMMGPGGGMMHGGCPMMQ